MIFIMMITMIIIVRRVRLDWIWENVTGISGVPLTIFASSQFLSLVSPLWSMGKISAKVYQQSKFHVKTLQTFAKHWTFSQFEIYQPFLCSTWTLSFIALHSTLLLVFKLLSNMLYCNLCCAIYAWQINMHCLYCIEMSCLYCNYALRQKSIWFPLYHIVVHLSQCFHCIPLCLNSSLPKVALFCMCFDVLC